MFQFNRQQFEKDGYVILKVLSDAELKRFLAAANEHVARPDYVERRRTRTTDVLARVSFLLPDQQNPILQESIYLPRVLEVVEAILGSPLILDNAGLMAAEPGMIYKQGWHRDILQIPEDQIDDRMFSPQWRHNNVQINLALVNDDGFWAVPGSHNRPNSIEENAAFAGSKHLSPVEARMPHGRSIPVKAGEAAFYHNNLIHRGYCVFERPRRTLHMGYHCAKHPPTWHFYSNATKGYPQDYFDSLSPAVREMLQASVQRRREFPDITASYRAGFSG